MGNSEEPTTNPEEKENLLENEDKPSQETNQGDQPNNDQPPSYDSVFGKHYRDARQQSSNKFEFMQKLVESVLMTSAATLCMVILLAIPITSIFFGFKYKHDCPIQKYIPIYLIVMGIVVTVSRVCDLFCKCIFAGEQLQLCQCFQAIAGCFIFGWFIAGNVWIYKAYQPDYADPSSELYCNKTLYLFAFWTTTATYIILACLCCCLGCVVCCAVLTE